MGYKSLLSYYHKFTSLLVCRIRGGGGVGDDDNRHHHGPNTNNGEGGGGGLTEEGGGRGWRLGWVGFRGNFKVG